MRSGVAALVAFAATAMAGIVHADPSRPVGDAPLIPAAREQFDRGAAHFARKEDEPAIAAFRKAYEIDPRPEILFAWAQAERLSGDCASAISLYDRFLATGPVARQATAAEENKALCSEALRTRPVDRTAVRQDSGVSSSAVARRPTQRISGNRRTWYSDPLGGAQVGAAVIGLGAGGWLFVKSQNDADDASGAATVGAYQDRLTTARRERVL